MDLKLQVRKQQPIPIYLSEWWDMSDQWWVEVSTSSMGFEIHHANFSLSNCLKFAQTTIRIRSNHHWSAMQEPSAMWIIIFVGRDFQVRAFLWWGRWQSRKERKKPKICTIYRKLKQIVNFSLPHPSGAPSSEGAAKLKFPTASLNFFNNGGACINHQWWLLRGKSIVWTMELVRW